MASSVTYLQDSTATSGNDEAPGYSSDAGSPTEILDEPEIVVQRRLSTVRSTAVVEKNRRLEIRLQADETVTLVGEYDLQVIRGCVLVCGALLRPSERPSRIFAPSCHALPGITAKGGIADVIVLSTGKTLRGFSRLSPLYGRLWNEDAGLDSVSVEAEKLSCSVVSMSVARDKPMI